MFWFLHRAGIAAFWCLWLVAAFVVYEQRAVLEPAFDYPGLVWRHGLGATQDLPTLEGKVMMVFAGDSFQFVDAGGYGFNYGLAGVTAPRAGRADAPGQKRLADLSRTNLLQLLAGRHVAVTVTLANPQTRTGLGLVHCGRTNINAAVLAAGQGWLNPRQIELLPLAEEFELLRAEHQAQRLRVGVWSEPRAAAAAQ
jgi:endonuclease YncB( thermonuclease family)